MPGKGSAPSPCLLTHRGLAQSRCVVQTWPFSRRLWLSLMKDWGIPNLPPTLFL